MCTTSGGTRTRDFHANQKLILIHWVTGTVYQIEEYIKSPELGNKWATPQSHHFSITASLVLVAYSPTKWVDVLLCSACWRLISTSVVTFSHLLATPVYKTRKGFRIHEWCISWRILCRRTKYENHRCFFFFSTSDQKPIHKKPLSSKQQTHSLLQHSLSEAKYLPVHHFKLIHFWILGVNFRCIKQLLQ